MADLMTGTYSTENLRRDNGGFIYMGFFILKEGKKKCRSFQSGELFFYFAQQKISPHAAASLSLYVCLFYTPDAAHDLPCVGFCCVRLI